MRETRSGCREGQGSFVGGRRGAEVDLIELAAVAGVMSVSAMRAVLWVCVSLAPALHTPDRITSRCSHFTGMMYAAARSFGSVPVDERQRAWWLARQAAHRRPVGPLVAVHAHVVFVVRPPAALPA